MPNIVGIGNSQVPTNAMLGDLAYQDSVGEIDLEKIKARTGDTANDVFVYDTRKDSDGGAWRHRTQHTSWYNEGVSQGRGARKEFPVVAVLVTYNNGLRIYDGDDPNLPMWMEAWQYQHDSGTYGSTRWWGGSGTTNKVVAMNGMIVMGLTLGTRNLHFINDRMSLSYSPASGNYTQLGGIANRNDSYGSWGRHDQYYTPLRNHTTNDVAITVVPNSMIDVSTGLPNPTFAVASDSGVTVRKSDFSAVDIYRSNDDDVHHVDFDGDRVIMSMELGAIYVAKIPSSDQSGNPNADWTVYGTFGANALNHPRVLGLSHPQSLAFMKNHTFVAGGTGTSTEMFKGFSISSEDVNSSGNGMVAYIRDDCNTGWLHGNNKGAFLTDTVTEKDGVNYALQATQHATGRLTAESYDAGDVSFHMQDDASSDNGYLAINLNGLTVGQSYKITMTRSAHAHLDTGYDHRIDHNHGTQGQTYFYHWDNNTSSSHVVTGVFVAKTSGDDDLVIYSNGAYIEISNFKIEETDDINGHEYVTNGNFSNGLTGWTQKINGSGSLSVNGSNQVVIVSQNSSNQTELQQTVVVPKGVDLIYSFDLVSGSIYNGGFASSNLGTGTYQFTINIPGTGTQTINLWFTPPGWSGSGTLDNISIRHASIDRSAEGGFNDSTGANNQRHGIGVYGQIAANPVATNAELVAYGPFSGRNFFRQPPNSSMNIGTGDAYEIIWFKTTNASSTMMLISYEGGANGTSDYGKPFNIRYEGGVVRGWASHNGFNTYDDVSHGVSTADGKWHCAAWVRRGQVFELYVDGEFIGSDTGAVGSNALSDANSELVIGARKRGKAPTATDHEESFDGYLALARIGKTAPTAKQIKKMYYDEKKLFEENAKCTLYGTSSAVTALAYDDTNDIIHAGTSAGRSEFVGLNRINNTTTAVTTAISASDGLVAEQ